jgi:redox-sensitive bicupin YhaK (pirin superfamily)
MRETIHKREQIASTIFGGRFHANKPVVGGRTPRGAASSSVFYWSHAETTGACEFGLHGHEGFEIMTFVLAGENAHYDTETRRWTPLRAGDFQVIQSGSGISHGERVAAGTRAFQIWFDPDLRRAVTLPPAYADYPSGSQPSVVEGPVTVTKLVGGGGVRPATEGLAVRKLLFTTSGEVTLPLAAGQRYALYVTDGKASLDGALLDRDDMMNASGGSLRVEADAGAGLFVIETPLRPSYTPLVDR